MRGRRVTRGVYLLDLAGLGARPEYEQLHRPGAVPAAVLADIRMSGITSMEIYCFSDRLVMLTEAPCDILPGRRGLSAISDQWEERMDRLQRRLPGTPKHGKWQPAARIFNFFDH